MPCLVIGNTEAYHQKATLVGDAGKIGLCKAVYCSQSSIITQVTRQICKHISYWFLDHTRHMYTYI